MAGVVREARAQERWFAKNGPYYERSDVEAIRRSFAAQNPRVGGPTAASHLITLERAVRLYCGRGRLPAIIEALKTGQLSPVGKVEGCTGLGGYLFVKAEIATYYPPREVVAVPEGLIDSEHAARILQTTPEVIQNLARNRRLFSRGDFFQRFGPVNGPNGHRRLNVLFTRAKIRVEVFSSMNANQIRIESNSNLGLKAFKSYLYYAQTGIIESSCEGSNEMETNDFERSVARILTAEGYDVVHQVGVAGFYTDLAVRHPTLRGKYLAGIECDGASYHSGRSARDRDRLRQEILENLGWKIYRIWSTDWFKNRAHERTRLLGYLSAQLKNEPEHVRRKDLNDRARTLRQELIRYRMRTYARLFRMLLWTNAFCDEMLDRFVAKRPMQQSDWFNAFSENMRSQTESEQVKQHLRDILEIIKSFV